MKNPSLLHRYSFKLTLVFALFSLALIGCIESITPESATNPVGTTHEITVNITDSVPNLGTYGGDYRVIFEVVDGPNDGTISADDCDVGGPQPTCTTSGDDTVSWQYQSNGQPGTDTIIVCVVPLDEIPTGTVQTPPGIPSQSCSALMVIVTPQGGQGGQATANPARCLAKGGDLFGFCRVVTKTWVEEDDDHDRDKDRDRRKNTATPTATPTRTPTPTPTITPTPVPTRGPNLSGVVAPSRPIDRTPVVQQAQPAPAQPPAPLPVVRPPSTGDAGLVED